MKENSQKETWANRTGVILAVAGSAIGLANFLRFPGQAAKYGGGAFMIAYFISLLLLAIPIAWAEWTMGRYGGQKGVSSCPGIFNVICKHPLGRYLGILGVLVPIVIYTYYSYIGSWCLGYALNFLGNQLNFSSVQDAETFWTTFIGANEDGSALKFGFSEVGTYFIIVFILNFCIVYRGISKGIEKLCKYSVPTLIIIGIIILIRVLTLGTPDTTHPENNILNGLGFMWNPTKVYLQENVKGKWIDASELIGKDSIEHYEKIAAQNPQTTRLKKVSFIDQLKRPQLWLAAASQIFFSLSVGFGLVITYASYMKQDDDVVLSSLCATSANEFCEVGLGGLITLPAAYAFLGATSIAGQGIFGLGFKTLPLVFSKMNSTTLLGMALPWGNIFGFLFFFLLFLAATTAVVSTLQPGIAFLEETLNIGRKRSVALLGMITALGCSFVIWFSKDSKALDTFDFWAGNFLIYVIATIQIIIFGWIMGVDKGFAEANHGALIKIPKIYYFITKYIAPLFLLTIFVLWILIDVLGLGGKGIDSHILDLVGSPTQPISTVAWLGILNIGLLAIFMGLIANKAPKYNQVNKF